MNEESIRYSVLMSVYHKEKAEYLEQAMNSIWSQTISTDDFVLVCDGPLTEELDTVINNMQDSHADALRVMRLEKNVGLGNALNYGIKKCKNELVARMDSDDISRKDRCEKQLEVFKNQLGVSICSGIVEEFSLSTDIIESRRVPPENQNQILEFARKRNPFNHPCVMYKKSAVEASGGYLDLFLLEDYYLWIRMLQNGYIGYNLQEPLLWMRAGSKMYKRRSGFKYAEAQKRLFKYMRDCEFITKKQYLCSVIVRRGSSLAPNWMRKIFFSCFLRK